MFIVDPIKKEEIITISRPFQRVRVPSKNIRAWKRSFLFYGSLRTCVRFWGYSKSVNTKFGGTSLLWGKFPLIWV